MAASIAFSSIIQKDIIVFVIETGLAAHVTMTAVIMFAYWVITSMGQCTETPMKAA